MATFHEDCEYSSFLWPGGRNCSSKGSCVNPSSDHAYCSCDAGYSGVNDFNLKSEDCDVQLGFAKFTWVLLLAFSIVSYLVGLVHLLLLIYFKRSYRHNPLVTTNLAYYALVVASSLLFILVGIWKLSDFRNQTNENVIGQNPAVTLSFSFAVFFWWASAFLFMKKLVELFILRLKRFPAAGLADVPTYPYVKLILWVFVFGVIFPNLCLIDVEHCCVYASIHHVGQGILTGVASLYYNPKYVSTIIKNFGATVEHLRNSENSSSDQNAPVVAVLESMLWKLKIEKQIGSALGFSTMILYGMFGIWPYLLRRSTYAIAIGFSCAAIMMVIITIIFGIELRKTAENSSRRKVVGAMKSTRFLTLAEEQGISSANPLFNDIDINNLDIIKVPLPKQKSGFFIAAKQKIHDVSNSSKHMLLNLRNSAADISKSRHSSNSENKLSQISNSRSAIQWRFGHGKKTRIYIKENQSGFEHSQDDTWPEYTIDSVTYDQTSF